MKYVLLWCALQLACISFAERPSSREYVEAFTGTNFTECQTRLDPLLQRTFASRKEGDSAAVPEALAILANRIFSLRIRLEEKNYSPQFLRMEYYLRLIADGPEAIKKRPFFIAFADYLSAETVVPLPSKLEFEKAKALDEELIREGKIERPVVFINRASTPNLRKLGEQADRKRSWNSAVERHRRHVLRCFEESMAHYLSTLNTVEAKRFIDEFSAKAKLSSKENDILFKHSLMNVTTTR